jgi:ABC-type sugar transport system substrate-binding protein
VGEPVRVLVCGGRDFNDRALMAVEMQRLWVARGYPAALIHGDARGADRLAEEWAKRHGVPVLSFPADWENHGRAAGSIRNQLMLDAGKPDLVVAFPGGRGTADMVRRAKAAGVPVVEVPAPGDRGKRSIPDSEV